MLSVRVPDTRKPERQYVVSVLLRDFLGMEFDLQFEQRQDVQISVHGDNQRTLVVSDRFLSIPDAAWLTAASIPPAGLREWRLPPELSPGLRLPTVPVLFGPSSPAEFCRLSPKSIRFGVDLIGGAFFFLTRYEELVFEGRDVHGRFTSTASIGAREGFLLRPIVNEYLEVLWQAMRLLWPRLERRRREFHLIPTHDVDRPFVIQHGRVHRIPLQLLADFWLRDDSRLAGRRLVAWGRRLLSQPYVDPNDTFDWIMDQSENRGLTSVFNFLHRSGLPIDADYDLGEESIQQLMRRINARGHEIGFHPSYNSYSNPRAIAEEFGKLKHAAEAAGLRQTHWGGRQHYLRWAAPCTWKYWDAAGLDYDSSVGFADAAGFRCGTCYEFPTFDLVGRCIMRLTERPLIAMEAALISEYASEHERAVAEQTLHGLRDECRHFRGDFVLLWHNSRLLAARDQALYRSVLG